MKSKHSLVRIFKVPYVLFLEKKIFLSILEKRVSLHLLSLIGTAKITNRLNPQI